LRLIITIPKSFQSHFIHISKAAESALITSSLIKNALHAAKTSLFIPAKLRIFLHTSTRLTIFKLQLQQDKLSGNVCWLLVISHTLKNDEVPPWYALLGGVAGTVGAKVRLILGISKLF
jgi:hypothetical protein